jgi:hypothetical protein
VLERAWQRGMLGRRLAGALAAFAILSGSCGLFLASPAQPKTKAVAQKSKSAAKKPKAVKKTAVVSAAGAVAATTVRTVNRNAGEDLWHLRSALNVAALACTDSGSGMLAQGYNAMLKTHSAALNRAVKADEALFSAKGGKWRNAYDSHMTNVYNLYSNVPRRTEFCGSAADILVHLNATSASQVTLVASSLLRTLHEAAGLP